MSSHETSLNGITYVRSKDAARIVQLAPDYVSTLARGNLIDGRQVDGLWYVNIASLNSFIADQERQKEIRRALLAEQRREEQRAAGHPATLSRTRSIFMAGAAVLILCISFPYATFAAQLPTHDLNKFLKRARTVHERGIRISVSLSLKVPTHGEPDS